jgi:hypothetical protein
LECSFRRNQTIPASRYASHWFQADDDSAVFRRFKASSCQNLPANMVTRD